MSKSHARISSVVAGLPKPSLACSARPQPPTSASTTTFYIEGGLLEGAAPVTVFRAVLDSIYRAKTGR